MVFLIYSLAFCSAFISFFCSLIQQGLKLQGVPNFKFLFFIVPSNKNIFIRLRYYIGFLIITDSLPKLIVKSVHMFYRFIKKIRQYFTQYQVKFVIHMYIFFFCSFYLILFVFGYLLMYIYIFFTGDFYVCLFNLNLTFQKVVDLDFDLRNFIKFKVYIVLMINHITQLNMIMNYKKKKYFVIPLHSWQKTRYKGKRIYTYFLMLSGLRLMDYSIIIFFFISPYLWHAISFLLYGYFQTFLMNKKKREKFERHIKFNNDLIKKINYFLSCFVFLHFFSLIYIFYYIYL